MAFIPGAKNDVFVSYAHIDNEGGATGEQWVSDFAKRLEKALRERLGAPVAMYFDTRSLEGHENLQVLLENARHAAILVVVLSPGYVNGRWTKDELEAFNAVDPANRTIFTIERLPLEDGPDAYPPVLRERKRTLFWYPSEDSGAVTILTHAIEPERYLGRLNDVVDHMTKQLRALRAIARAAEDTEAGNTGGTNGGTAAGASAGNRSGNGITGREPAVPVLLAQVTEDLDEQRDHVRRHLEQFGVPVLPAHPYPQGGAQFTQAFQGDLSRAGLFVQLVGEVAGRRPPDLPKGYTQHQFDLAAASKAQTLLWRRPELKLSSVTGSHAALVGHPDVRAMSLEVFKADVVKQARLLAKPPAPATAPRPNLIFINSVAEDRALAEALEDGFVSKGCAVAQAATTGRAEVILNDLRENIIECNALILIYGSAEDVWIRSQLRLYNKWKPERKVPECVVLICNASPAPKAPVGMRLPESHEIDYAGVLSSRPVVELLSRMGH